MKEDTSVRTSAIWPINAVGWLELILKIILITASLSAIYQYFDVKQENRIKKTLEFVDNFNTGMVFDAKSRVNSLWDGYREDIKLLNQERVTNKEKVKIMRKIVLPVVLGNFQHQSDIDLLVDYFANLQTCIDKKICDKNTAQSFLGEYAYRFLNFFRPWIEENRSYLEPKFARGLEDFVQQSGY